MRRRESALAPVKPDMTPMIDCVFQLMIFFMLTLKIVAAEGNFEINLPAQGPEHVTLAQDIKVRMISNENGDLVSLRIDQRNLGYDDEAFENLNREILRAIGGTPGGPLVRDTEVEIDADPKLHYVHVMQAISAISGRANPATGQVVRYIEKIKFTPRG